MLSNVKCRNARPASKPYKLVDGYGLYLEVRPSGSKIWRYRYELIIEGQRRERLFTIGHFTTSPPAEDEHKAEIRRCGGLLTLAEARDERARARALVKQGVCPVQQRQGQRLKRRQEAAATVAVLANEWLATKQWEDVTKKRRLKMLERVVFPRIGSVPVKDVNPRHILDLLQGAAKNNGPSVAAEAKRTLSGVFGHAIATLQVETDPVAPVAKALPANKTQHKRALTRAEIGKLLRSFAAYERNHQTLGVFSFMWLTLCRPCEATGARWDEIDFENAFWRIPARRMKMRRDHIVPLPRQATSLLRAMYGITGRHAHVFPHRDHRDRGMTENTLRVALNKLGWSGRYSPHATRATGSTILNELGYNRDWIERQLAHRPRDTVRASYNHATYITERATMMQAWADLLDELKDGLPMNRNKAHAPSRGCHGPFRPGTSKRDAGDASHHE